MVDEDKGSEGLGVCKVEDAARQADESVISILRGARADDWNAYVSRISAGSDMTPCLL